MSKNLAKIRFYAELNDFFPPNKRKKEFNYYFWNRPAIKDVIESLGVPHTEVDLILINGKSVKFSHPLQEGDYVSVYPVFETFDITPIVRLRPKPLRHIKFILDVHLGKLAKYLRLLGFDTLYQNDYQDAEIIQIAKLDKRIILTRDLGILKNKKVSRGYFLRKIYPKQQLQEVLQRFDLKSKVVAFSRCLECNTRLRKIAKNRIVEKLPIKTRQYYESFCRCPKCKRIYWEGSHYQRMKILVDEIIEGNIEDDRTK